MTYFKVVFLEKSFFKSLNVTTPLPHLVYAVLWILKWAPPPLTHTSSEIHLLMITHCV